MNIDDKLQHFMDVSMKSASQKKEALINDYKSGMDIQFENYKKDMKNRYELQKKSKEELIKRELSKDFAAQQQHIRRKYNHKNDDLKTKLFDEVNNMLNEFFTTSEYSDLLISEIKTAKEIAESCELLIYIDPLDADKKDFLEKETNVSLSISSYSFGRGMRAIIEAKNILIDNSFDYKINEIKEIYTINL